MQLAKEELETKQNELEAMMKQLEQSKEMEIEERNKLEDDIRTKQQEVQRMADEVQQKDEETRRLQDEVEEARRKQEEAARALIVASSNATQVVIQSSPPTPLGNHVAEQYSSSDEDGENGKMNGSGSEMAADFGSESAQDIPRPEEDRVTAVSKQLNLQEQLKMLSKDLAANKDDSKVTKNDILHQENVRQGRDKYKTLREIRKGNTKRRVDQFENM